MGLFIALTLALLVLAMLWRFAHLQQTPLQLVGAALFLALAAYAWQGRPSLSGQAPPGQLVGEDGDKEFSSTREAVFGRFDRASQWLIIADSYQRRGDTRNAVGILSAAVRRDPRDSDLWTGLGYMLVLHADRVVTPAAQLAFERAASVAPGAPGPRFYYGLALARGGRFVEAEQVWGALLATAPEGAEWVPLLAQRLALVRRVRTVLEQRRPVSDQ